MSGQTDGRWPWINDTDLARARAVAWCYREHLRTNNRALCDIVDQAMIESGQRWVVPSAIVYADEDLVTTDVAAEIVHRDRETIRQWRRRGYLNPQGQRCHLEVRGLSESRQPQFRVGEVRAIAALLNGR